MIDESKPRLILDAYVLSQGIKTGVYRVCHELYPLLIQSDRFRCHLHFRPTDEGAIASWSSRLGALAVEAPTGGSCSAGDVFVSPFGVAPPQWTTDTGVLHAHIIYDLIGVSNPEYFSTEGAAEVRRIMDSLNERTVVFAISESTKKDLLAYRPDLCPSQVTVIPLAAGEAFRPCAEVRTRAAMRAKYGIPPDVPYVLSLATLEIRKNLDQVVLALLSHLEQNPGSDLHLVLSGMSGWKLERLQSALAAAERWRHRIVVTGFVEEEDLSALYSDALCFVYLSRYEGFGLPPLEAMACGTPVICSNNSSLPEVVGRAGLMFDAYDVQGVADAIHQIATHPSLKEQLAEAGQERAKLFRWERCAEIVAETLSAAYLRHAEQAVHA